MFEANGDARHFLTDSRVIFHEMILSGRIKDFFFSCSSKFTEKKMTFQLSTWARIYGTENKVSRPEDENAK